MTVLKVRLDAAEPWSARGALMDLLLDTIEAEPDETTRGVLTIELLGERGGIWTVDLNARELYEGTFGEADCTLRIAESAFSELMRGRLSVGAAFRDGRIECYGDVKLLASLAVRIREAR